ncbi:hybrid sensor histidine kinase/response regulator [Sphingobacterium sp. HJSM2_6]|uniref:ATP-binding response regulator n=1 Tax=Sphingobacterium sp. HJSM2_6 TaxID=3366264 RepID=UPI003BEC197E
MEDKELLSNSKRNKKVRNVLLISILILFVTFLIVFIFSYIQYKSIHTRIQNIYHAINNDKNDFSELLNLFNETENHFRIFSITYDHEDYLSYREHLIKLKSSVDSLSQHRNAIQANQKYSNEQELKIKELVPKYQSLNTKLDSILMASEQLKDFHLENNDKKLFQIPGTQKTVTNIQVQPKSTEVVIERKPFFKRVFQKKKDTIRIDNFDSYQTQQTEVKQSYQKTINKNNALTKAKLNELQMTLSELRKNERSLLADNFTLLRSANQLIRVIHDVRIQIQRENTDRELNTLITNTDTFKWQIIISLTFVFIMICILVYYQFFSAYYERKLMEERIYASKLAEQKTDILAEITHEIRTPLNSLIGIVDLLKSRKDLYEAKDILLLDSAYSNIVSTSKTINDILNLSKIDQHDSIEANYFDINDLFSEIIESHQNQAEQKNIRLAYEIDGHSPSIVFSDEIKIRQIVSNLVSNAIKYSAKGTVNCNIHITEDHILTIVVSDEGQGIPDNLKKNIFKKYYTVNKSTKIESGVGLGLYITKNIVNMLNGKITFKSTFGSGTTFTVELPIPEPKFRRKTTLNIHKINDLPKDINWLIVDDNALNLLYLKQFFSAHEHVFTAINGKIALDIIEKETIDVVVTDINMPIMRGDELLWNIRNNPVHNQIKIIATSSDNEQVKKLEKERKVKFDGILIKPFNERKLTEVILKTIYPIFEDSNEVLGIKGVK